MAQFKFMLYGYSNGFYYGFLVMVAVYSILLCKQDLSLVFPSLPRPGIEAK